MTKELSQFLSHVWGSKEGIEFLATKQKDLFKVSSALNWPSQSDKITHAVTALNATKDVYFTPGRFKEAAGGKHKDNGLEAKCLWVDVDGYKDGQSTPQEAIDKIVKEGLIPLPTYRNQTSHENAQHWYWVLDEYQDAEVINDLNRRLAYYLNADKACWDISHVMRPPMTINHKQEHRQNGISPTVTVVDFTGEFFSVDQFESIPQVREQIQEALELGELPSLQTVFMKYPWDSEHIERFNRDKSYFYDEEKKDYTNRGNAMVGLAYFCAEIGMSDEAIYVVLNDCDQRWGKFQGRKDQQYQLAVIIQKVRTKYPSALIVEVEDEEVEEKTVYGFAEFLKSKFQFKWIYTDFLPENTINFITGLSGTGKSRFVLQMCSQLALGREFLSWKLEGNPRKVLFLSLEMGAPVLKKFMTDMTRAEGWGVEELKVLDQNFKVVPAGEPLPLTSPGGIAFMTDMMETHSPDIIFIDAMGSLDYDELKETVSKKIMTALKRILNERKITLFLVHHNRKPEAQNANRPPTLADFYGNTYGATDAATVVSLWKNPKGWENTLELHTLKSRVETGGKPILLDSSRFTFTVKGIVPNDGTGENHSTIQDFVGSQNPEQSSGPTIGFSAPIDPEKFF